MSGLTCLDRHVGRFGRIVLSVLGVANVVNVTASNLLAYSLAPPRGLGLIGKQATASFRPDPDRAEWFGSPRGTKMNTLGSDTLDFNLSGGNLVIDYQVDTAIVLFVLLR